MQTRFLVTLSLSLSLACSRSSIDDLEFDGPGPGHAGGDSGGRGGRGGGEIGRGGTAGNAGRAGGGGTGGSGGIAGAGPGGSAGFGGFGAIGGAGGFTGTCTLDRECVVAPNACFTGSCVNGACVFQERDEDRDGHIDSACGGDDCNDRNPLAHPGLVEQCTDGADNDCNGVMDCNDPACKAAPLCGCLADPAGERCQNGADDDCDGTVDCNDADCIGQPACGCSPRESRCGDGTDDDCDGLVDCSDGDCAATPLCQCQGVTERCQNGADDDCDGLVDCTDPDCAASGQCSCTPPAFREVCDDFRDDDCDGLVDCADPDCIASPACAKCTVEVCSDGVDNDCNGAIDCADDSCRFAPNCVPTAELCNNGKDDDADGFIDCLDTDCATNPTCVKEHASCVSPAVITASGTYTGNTTGHVGQSEGTCGGAAGEGVYRLILRRPTRVSLDTIGSQFDTTLYVRTGACTAGRELGCDDDSGGAHASALTFGTLPVGDYFVFVDGFTVDATAGPDEGPYVLNVNLDVSPVEQCDNKKDDDGDRYVDCADPDCASLARCKTCNGGGRATPEFGPGACTDGQDNDCDGQIDCGDRDCSASDVYVTECCNGVDENGNGIVDDFACRCSTNADCTNGDLCYGDTVSACGPPCTNFVGDICPFAAPGSTCNAATQQCEF